jgi:uncharacterized coiled-coil protein SlyX
MSLKSENIALRDQVARLTERLKNVQREETLSATIVEMQRQAASQQEEMEHLRKRIGAYEKAEQDANSRVHLATELLSKQVAKLQGEKTVLDKKITILTEDNARLTTRLAEVSAGIDS